MPNSPIEPKNEIGAVASASAAQIGELIERLEKATGPDRKVDLDIWRFVRKCRPSDDELKLERCGHEYDIVFVDSAVHEKGYCLGTRRINFTASIDAALTLVPEGWAWSLHHHRDCSGPSAEPLAKVSRVNWDEKENETEFYKSANARGATPAIALCIAALKAHRTLSGDVSPNQ